VNEKQDKGSEPKPWAAVTADRWVEIVCKLLISRTGQNFGERQPQIFNRQGGCKSGTTPSWSDLFRIRNKNEIT
jgi:hypothetical protein